MKCDFVIKKSTQTFVTTSSQNCNKLNFVANVSSQIFFSCNAVGLAFRLLTFDSFRFSSVDTLVLAAMNTNNEWEPIALPIEEQVLNDFSANESSAYSQIVSFFVIKYVPFAVFLWNPELTDTPKGRLIWSYLFCLLFLIW